MTFPIDQYHHINLYLLYMLKITKWPKTDRQISALLELRWSSKVNRSANVSKTAVNSYMFFCFFVAPSELYKCRWFPPFFFSFSPSILLFCLHFANRADKSLINIDRLIYLMIMNNWEGHRSIREVDQLGEAVQLMKLIEALDIDRLIKYFSIF